MDDGPSDISSFHVIGTIFDTVYKEGAYLLQPGRRATVADRRSTSRPRRAASSSSAFPFPGKYPFITHKFADATKGAAGVFVAGNVPADAAG